MDQGSGMNGRQWRRGGGKRARGREGERERGREGEMERGEGECFGVRERERECKEKVGMVSERECKEIERRLTAKKEEVVE